MERLEDRSLLASFVSSTLSMPNSGLAGVVSDDLNGDGRADIAASTFSTGTAYVALGNGNGTFGSVASVSTGLSGSADFGITSGNLSGTPHPELVVSAFSSGAFRVLSNSGAGAFSAGTSVGVGGSSEQPVIADMNNDGFNDVVTGRFSLGGVAIAYGNGAGGFSSTSIIPGRQSVGVIVGDFNGDLRPDIATANYTSNSMTVYLNQGGTPVPAFSTTMTDTLADTAFGIVAFDADGDRDIDIAVANMVSNSVTVFENNGAGTFARRVSLNTGGTGAGAVGLETGDFDGDGDMDLVATLRNQNQIRVLRNNGSFSFVPETPISVGQAPYSLEVADFNGDRRADIAVGNQNSAAITILTNVTASADIIDVTPDPRLTAVDTVDIVFSRPVNLSTFDDNDITLTRNGGGNLISSAVTVVPVTGSTYRISGLSAMTSAVGTYQLSVNLAGINDLSGQAMPVEIVSDSWVRKTPLTILDTSFLTSGTLNAGATTITVTFSEPPLNATIAANYELRGAGADGLLLISGAVVNPTNVSINGNAATLTFPALTEDVYRLTVKDAITDLFGNPLDGDGNGTAAGNWRRDFVAGALSTALTSPNGFVFDPHFYGPVAGQLVQGTDAAFDGLNRLLVNEMGIDFPPQIVSGVKYQELSSTSSTALSSSAWTTVPGLSSSITVTETTAVQLSALLNVSSTQNWPGVGEVRFVVDGVAQPVAATFKNSSYFVSTLISGNTVGAGEHSHSLGVNGYTLTALSTPYGHSHALGGRTESNGTHSHAVNLTLPTPWSLTSVSADDWITLAAGTYSISVEIKAGDTATRLDGRQSMTTASFLPVPIATLHDSNTTVQTGTASVSELSVHRRVTVPSTGSQDFARTIDVFHNPTASAISTTVRIVGNLGSDGATTVFATADGDGVVETTDQWIGTDDADGVGTPAIVHYIHGPAGLRPTAVEVIEDNIHWTYDITVPAGETLRLAHFTILADTQANAVAAAKALVTEIGFGGEAAAYLTPEEIASLANFRFDQAPTDIGLSGNTVAENSAVGTIVGSLSTDDLNPGDTHSYQLVSGDGSADNGLFQIVGSSLRTAAVFDYEQQNQYSLRVRSTDRTGLSVEKIFTVDVTNVSELIGIDVQLGQTQRSYVRYLDVLFDSPNDLMGIINNGRLQLTGYDLNGQNSFIRSTTNAAVVGNAIRIDFGEQGIGENRSSRMGDGFYQIAFDDDADGNFESGSPTRSFHRLLGDVNGDGRVDSADKTQVMLANRTTSVESDANGDGIVNILDVSLVSRAANRRLSEGLFVDD